MSEYPMVEQVNRLIGNRLAAGGELFLPGVGSLYTERRGARAISKRMVEPPCRMVVFSSQQRGEPLEWLIARTASCDPAQAQEIYARWLEQTLRDDVLTIGGVGVLRLKHFTMDEAFDRRLNPQGRMPVRIRSLHRFDWALWCGVAAILFAVIFGGYQFLMLFPDERAEVVPVKTETVATTPGPAVDTLAGGTEIAGAQPADGQTTDLAGRSDNPAEPTGRSESRSESTTGHANSAEPALSGRSEYQAGAAVAAGSEAAAEPGAADRAAQTGASERIAEPTRQESQAVTPAASERPASLVSGRKYVVLGVFSTAENAARAVRNAAAAKQPLACRVYRFGEKFLVSPFESEDAAACARFIREQQGRYRDLWTYTAR